MPVNKTLLLLLAILVTACSPANQEPSAPAPLTPETALRAYLDSEDNTFTWKIADSMTDEGLTVTNLILTSQKWREHTWKHQLTVMVPGEVKYHDALLFITGGKLGEDGQPELTDPQGDDLLKAMARISVENQAVVSILYQTPNQPLYDGLYEDALISYTLHQYRESKDFTWPLLFPMTKSAIKAMEAVQEFSSEEYKTDISGFVVSGASKRGWTTWLAGAFDSRVRAICPMVIDVLNMPDQMDYQVTAWGAYSEEIQDYVDLGIAQDVSTPEGQELVEMIDPYSYREKLTMPKMIFLGTNDAYWPADALRHYLEDIPGENYLHWVANAGHDLNGGGQALNSLSAFFARTIRGLDYPDCSWSVAQKENKVEIFVKAENDGSLLTAKLWTASSPDRDFRNDQWINTDLKSQGKSEIKVGISLPMQGFRAFYVDLVYPSPLEGTCTQSTRIFVMDSSGIL